MEAERLSFVTEDALFKLLIKWLNKLDWKMENLVDQCYDGANSMRREYQRVVSGLQQAASLTKVQQYNELLFFP